MSSKCNGNSHCLKLSNKQVTQTIISLSSSHIELGSRGVVKWEEQEGDDSVDYLLANRLANFVKIASQSAAWPAS